MTLLKRRFLFFGFVILFFVLIPIVLLYATGHTINWRRLQLEKTATILIDSEPNNATILFNGRRLPATFLNFFGHTNNLTTNARIKNLAPGEYTVRLEHDGYWPWEEQILLSPGEAYNFGTVNLYRRSEPALVMAKNGRIEFSNDKKNVAFIDKKNLTIINLADETKNTITLPKDLAKEAISWSADHVSISLGAFLIDSTTQEIIDLSTKVKSSLTNIQWDENDNDILYFLSKKKLWRYQKSINALTTIYDGTNLPITDYLQKNLTWYLIVREANNSESLLSGDNLADLHTIALPAGNYSFYKSSLQLPLLFDERRAFVLDNPLPLLGQLRLVEIPARFTIGQWLGNTLVYATPFELHRFSGENDDVLISRFGDPITALWPLEKKAAILVATDDSLRLLAQGRKPYTLNLASLSQISGFWVSPDEKTMYASGSFKNKPGLYRLSL